MEFDRSHTPCERGLMMLYGAVMAAIFAAATALLNQGALSETDLIGVMMLLFAVFAPVRSRLQTDTKLTIMDSCLNRLESVMAELPLEEGETENFV